MDGKMKVWSGVKMKKWGDGGMNGWKDEKKRIKQKEG